MTLATTGGLIAGVVPFGITTVVIAMLGIFMTAMVLLAVAPLISENRTAQLGTPSRSDRATVETNEAD